MANFKYKLQTYKGTNTRFTCPACGKPKRFTRYIDTATGEYISDATGKCDRADKCGYHQTPKQYFESTGVNDLTFVRSFGSPSKPNERTDTAPACSYIAAEILRASRTGYDANRFITYLTTLFPFEVVNQLIVQYNLGSSDKWPGATVFWQVDSAGKARSGKIMLYNAATGRRVKQPYNHVAWVHTHLKLADYNLQQCLFGEHLLHRYPHRQVALVESEKTALIASAYMPQHLWLATGSLQGLNARLCAALRGRDVVLWPDLKGYDTWKAKAEELKHLANFTVSDMLEARATPEQREQGCDLADYLINFDYRTFKPATQQPTPALPPVNETPYTRPVKRYKEPPLFTPEPGWDMERIETFYATYTPPTTPVHLGHGQVVNNPAKYINSHLQMVRARLNNRTFKPYYDRLVEWMEREEVPF